MRAYFIGSGILVAFLFLCLSAFIISLFGLESTSYVATLVMAAGVMAGGAYAIIFFGSIIIHVVRRLVTRQPIMEIED